MATVINLGEKFSRFSERWSPKIAVRVNDCHIKLVKFKGEFVWHRHEETDEVFLVWDGEMTVHFRDGQALLRQGEMIVVPKGVEHKTSAGVECQAVLIEAAGTVNTGDAGGDKTAPGNVWI